MFGSPATVRGGTGRRRGGDGASVVRGTPSLLPEPQGHVGLGRPAGSVRSSRLGQLRRAGSPVSSAGDTFRTGRTEVGTSEKTVWARNERYSVVDAGHLPEDVQDLIGQANAQPVYGHVDPSSGFAFVNTPTGCIAWNYQKRTHSSPTCYGFPGMLSDSGMLSRNPHLAALVSTSNSSEPGMMLIGEDGKIRYWESMSLALSNIDRHQDFSLSLGRDDLVEHIYPVDGNAFVITTRNTLAFRLGFISQGGRSSVQMAPFTRPGGMFARATTTIFPKSEDTQGITAAAIMPGTAFLLAGNTLQKWFVNVDDQRFVHEWNLADVVGQAIFEDDWRSASIDLRLDDIASHGDGELIVLTTYIEDRASSSSPQARHDRTYSIVLLSVDKKSHSLTSKDVIHPSYLSYHSHNSYANLLVPFASPLGNVQLDSQLVAFTLSPGDEYEDVISLKEGDLFIGTGSKSHAVSNRRDRDHGDSLWLMTSSGHMLSVRPSDDEREASSLDPVTASLKSKIEQAIFYGDRDDNPLVFEIPPGSKGDVASAAERISAEILDSSSSLMPMPFELRPLLVDRLARLRDLIAVVKRAGLLSKLPQSTRRKLSRDGERAKASIALWDYQNRYMDQSQTLSPQSLLALPIEQLMLERGIVGDDDMIRGFFRAQVRHLDRLLELVLATLQNELRSLTERRDAAMWILEADMIFTMVQREASTFREEEIQSYEIDREHPTMEYWTAKDTIIDALEFLYNQTLQAIRDRTREFGTVIDASAGDVRDPTLKQEQVTQATLKTQMTQIAAALCVNMEDKLRTHVTREMNEGTDPQIGLTLQKRWDDLRSRVIRPLVDIDRTEEAYELAEHHADYPTLVYLCHHAKAGTGVRRVQTYIERFGEEFAFTLYQWYIDQGRMFDLMSQDEVYGGYLTRFFELHDHPDLAWMHHITCKRYSQAASALLEVDKQADLLSQKHLISSIGKLTAVVDIKVKGGNQDSTKLLSQIDDQLDLIEIENALRSQLLDATTTSRQADRARIYVEGTSSITNDRPAFRHLLSLHIQRLLDGRTLDTESLVDVLTLKDDTVETIDEAATALHQLSRSTLPEGRKQVALLSIWRRVYISDDWTAIAKTSGRSEETQRQMQRRTFTYHTYRAIRDLPNLSPDYVLPPSIAAEAPTHDELGARSPEWTAQDIEALMRDHESEIALLNNYIEEADLETRVKEVVELVRMDAEEAQLVGAEQEDVFM